jgi:hypothetical protein
METLDAFDGIEVGRKLGHDFYRFTRLPAQADWPHAVREGFNEAAARRGARISGDRFERKWLQLRLGAWLRQRVVADNVSVKLLRSLDLSHCPVTRQPLTHGLRADTDWSIDRLNNDGAYAAGNLAVMSVRANRAKGSLTFEQVLALSRREQGGELSPAEWLRLAVLMQGPCFIGRQELAPLLPLVAPLPRHSVRLAIQQIQRLFALQAGRQAGKNALVKALLHAAPMEQQQVRLRLLAEAVHHGLKQIGPDDPCWDVWLQPRVMDALAQWKDSLDSASWARAARLSGELAGGQRLTTTSVRQWHLPTKGYAGARAWA